MTGSTGKKVRNDWLYWEAELCSIIDIRFCWQSITEEEDTDEGMRRRAEILMFDQSLAAVHVFCWSFILFFIKIMVDWLIKQHKWGQMRSRMMDAEPGQWGLYWPVMGQHLQQRDVKGTPLPPKRGAELTDPLLHPDVDLQTDGEGTVEAPDSVVALVCIYQTAQLHHGVPTQQPPNTTTAGTVPFQIVELLSSSAGCNISLQMNSKELWAWTWTKWCNWSERCSLNHHVSFLTSVDGGSRGEEASSSLDPAWKSDNTLFTVKRDTLDQVCFVLTAERSHTCSMFQDQRSFHTWSFKDQRSEEVRWSNIQYSNYIVLDQPSMVLALIHFKHSQQLQEEIPITTSVHDRTVVKKSGCDVEQLQEDWRSEVCRFCCTFTHGRNTFCSQVPAEQK